MDVLVSIKLPKSEKNVLQRMNGKGEVESRAVLSLILRADWHVADSFGLSQSITFLQNAGNGAVEERSIWFDVLFL